MEWTTRLKLVLTKTLGMWPMVLYHHSVITVLGNDMSVAYFYSSKCITALVL